MNPASDRVRALAALGIDLWVPRMAAAPAEVAAAPEPQAAQANAAQDAAWQVLAAEVAACRRCPLHASRTQTVFGVGNRHAELLVVGEAPGAEEDRQGEPFVGRAGQLLNAMLRALGWPRESVYIANVLKCRPPGNRDPSTEESTSCQSYLQRQIALLAPRIMLAVGRIAAQNLLATDTPIGKLRGRLHSYGERATPLVVTYHPAYLLRSPVEKRRAWADLRFLRHELQRLRQARER